MKGFAPAAVRQGMLAGCLMATTALGGFPVVGVALAQAAVAAEARGFEIPAQSLADALTSFGLQSGLQVSVNAAEIRGVTSPGVSGSLPPDQALGRLLAGTGFSFRISGTIATLERMPKISDGVIQLGPLRVEGDAGFAASSDAGATEHTGSYTMTGPAATATRLPLTWRETPQSISVVTRQQIDDQQLTSISELLKQAPGVTITHIGSERFYIVSRGFTLGDYQIDGINTATFTGNQNVPQGLVDMAIYDRVEVLRGAAGLLTGAGNPAGAVNLIRKRPTADMIGYVSASVGSWEKVRVEGDISGPLTDNGKVRGRLVGVYQHNESFRDAERLEKKIAYGAVEADLTETTVLGAGIDYLDYDPHGVHGDGVPLIWSDGTQADLPRSFNLSARQAVDRKRTYNINLRLEQEIAADWRFKLAANHLDGDRDFDTGGAFFAAGFPDRAAPVVNVGGELSQGTGRQRQNGVDAMIQGSFPLFGRLHELATGFNYTDYKNLHTANTAWVEPVTVPLSAWNHSQSLDAEHIFWGTLSDRVQQYGGYLTARLKPADGFSVILGSRITHYEYDNILDLRQRYGYYAEENYRTRRRLTPYAGLVYDLTGTLSLYASYTDIFSSQTVKDRNGNLLKPVIGSNLEAGVKAGFLDDRLNASIAVFRIKQDNFAELDPGYTVPGLPDTAAYRAVSGATSRGVEAEIAGEPVPGWNISASFSHNARKNPDGSRLTTTAPADTAKLWTTWRTLADRLTLGGGATWQSGTYVVGTPWQIEREVRAEQGAYAVIGLMARYQVTDSLSATLNVDNLFDKKYSSLEGQFYSGYYGQPRSALLTVKYDF